MTKQVKRILHINATYVVTAPHGATLSELRSERVRVLVQHPDGHLPANVLAAEVLVLTGRHMGERQYVQSRFRLLASEQEVCRCLAYRWPHRRFSGRCYANGEPPFCGNCGQPSKLGTRFSTCCQAPLFSDPELHKPFGTEVEPDLEGEEE